MDVVSTLNVFEIYGPLSNSLIYRQPISLISFALISDKTISSISVLAANKTSPVSLLKISLDKTFPYKNSSAIDISDAFELVSSFMCLAVILFPASTYTLVFTFISTDKVSPRNLSGIRAVLTLSLSNLKISSS